MRQETQVEKGAILLFRSGRVRDIRGVSSELCSYRRWTLLGYARVHVTTVFHGRNGLGRVSNPLE